MSTLPGFQGIDLFVTDLTTHTVRRLTTGKNVVNAAIRWSSDGSAIYHARTAATTASPPDNWRSEVVRVDVATGAAQSAAMGILGQITAIPHSGQADSRILIVGSTGPDSRSFEPLDLASDKRSPITGVPTDASVALADIVLLAIDDHA